MVRKWLNFLLAAVLTVTFCSCSGTPLQEGGAQNGVETHSESMIRLEFWEMQWGPTTGYSSSVQKLIEAFNESNGQEIVVESRVIPWDGYYEFFLQNVVAQTAPDVCSGAMPQPIQYASIGYALDLSPILGEWKEENSPILEEISEGYFEYFTYQKKLVGLPFGIDANALYYRKDLFEKAGIRDLPETMNELESVLRQLKAVYPEKVPFLFAAGIDADSTDVTQFFMEVNGGSAVTKEYTSAFQSKNNLDSFAYLERWVKDGLVSSDAVRYETEDAEKIFLADGACIILTSMRAGWLRNSDLYEICGVMGNITGNQVVNGYVTYSPQAYHGFSQTDHPEESRVFLKWLIENNLPLFTEGNSGIVPIRTSYQEELGRDDETLQIIMRNIGRYGRLYTYPFDSVQPFHSSLDGENIQTIPVTEILTGSDAVEALAKADQAFRKILDEEK